MLKTSNAIEAIGEARKLFLSSQLDDPEMEAQRLLARILNCSWGELMANPERLLSSADLAQYAKAIEKRKTGLPIAYIFNEQEFYGQTFFVDERVLIPRPETEILVEHALRVIPTDETQRVVDMGSGSGCIGLSLAKLRPLTKVLLIDQSPGALEVCQLNRQQLLLVEQVEMFLATIEGKSTPLPSAWRPVDVIVANPPYIPSGDLRVDWQVKNFEPHAALYGGDDGLEWIHKWLEWGYYNLRNQGVMFVEFGAGQSASVVELARKHGFVCESLIKDYQQIERIVQIRKV